MSATVHVGATAVVTRDEGETRALGALLAGLLEPGDVVLLVGDLGSGKTTLTKGIVAGLGGGDEVTSPTFTLVHSYATDPVVAHVDTWRLGGTDEVADLALDEVLDAGGVAVVEWGELAAPLFGDDALVVHLGPPPEPDGPAERRLVALRAASERWRGRVARLAAAARGAGLEVRP